MADDLPPLDFPGFTAPRYTPVPDACGIIEATTYKMRRSAGYTRRAVSGIGGALDMDSISDIHAWLQDPNIPSYILNDPRYSGDFSSPETPPRVRHTPYARTIHKRDGRQCQYCGITDAPVYEVEHVIPRCRGGVSKPYNLVVACQPCNERKRRSTWVPRNLDAITANHPEWRERVLAEAISHVTP